jgi:hypothetical protein
MKKQEETKWIVHHRLVIPDQNHEGWATKAARRVAQETANLLGKGCRPEDIRHISQDDAHSVLIIAMQEVPKETQDNG